MMRQFNEIALRSYEGDPLVVEWGGEDRDGRGGVAEIVCGNDGGALPVLREGGGRGRPHAYFRIRFGGTVLVRAMWRGDDEHAEAHVIESVLPDGHLALRWVTSLRGDDPYEGPPHLLTPLRICLDKARCASCDGAHYPDTHWARCAS
jgi:hypothetical protein